MPFCWYFVDLDAEYLLVKAMNNLYRCGEFIIKNNTLIICRVLSSQDGLFGRYIHAPTWHRLVDIICKFHDIIGLPNLEDGIDGTHIPLSYKSQQDLTPMPSDFFQ